MNVLDFQKRKNEGGKIAMTTCYDHWSAQILNVSTIDCILVGDSLAMVMHGHPSTLPATPEMMALHTAAVARGAPDKFIIGDMPFLSFRKGLQPAMDCVDLFVKAGARAVKLEGVEGHAEIIKNIAESGVPVMGHLGLTPHYINQFGGFTVQGRGDGAAERLVDQARRLEEAGCFSLVLECVPTSVAKSITENLSIPTIGIGAGPHVDGQVLVLHDMLGVVKGMKPKFVRTYLDGFDLIRDAVDRFASEVKELTYPSREECYK